MRQRLEAVAKVQDMVFKPGERSAEMVTTAQAMKHRLQPQDWLWMDPSAFAMAKGYDAVYHGKEQRFPDGEWVLLNRTAVSTLVPQRPPRTYDELYPEHEPQPVQASRRRPGAFTATRRRSLAVI